eukprot:SAG31_NODE_33358_length_344_cov_1.424490_1_plen_70_part_10
MLIRNLIYVQRLEVVNIALYFYTMGDSCARATVFECVILPSSIPSVVAHETSSRFAHARFLEWPKQAIEL